jgi:hypothetical protein
MNLPSNAKARFAAWGAVTGLACGGFLAPFALVFVPALQGATGAVILAILVAGALGGIVGVSVAIMKNDSEEL